MYNLINKTCLLFLDHFVKHITRVSFTTTKHRCDHHFRAETPDTRANTRKRIAIFSTELRVVIVSFLTPRHGRTVVHVRAL